MSYKERMQASSFFMGPHITPKSVKFLIWLIAGVSVLSPVLSTLLKHFYPMTTPLDWLPLSLWGLQKGWLWQVLSYVFIHSIGSSLSLSLLISLFFYMLLLWFSGSEIALQFGNRTFFTLFFGLTLFFGILSAILIFFFSSSAIIYSSTPPILGLMVIWMMLYPELELHFLFFIRVKAKWLVLIVIALFLLVTLSHGEWIFFVSTLITLFFAFLLGHFVWKLKNPFFNHFRSFKSKSSSNDKIIDISAIHEEDEAFMDRMLDKIAKEGEESLTGSERERMKKISERKKL